MILSMRLVYHRADEKSGETYGCAAIHRIPVDDHALGAQKAGSADASNLQRGIDAYNIATTRFEDVLVLADGDYVVRQHTQRSVTHGGRDYCNVYCFVFRFNAANKIIYLTEHWNTWYAHKFLLDNWQPEPAHPTS